MGAETLAEVALERLSGRSHDDVLRPLLVRLVVEASAVRREMAASVPSTPMATTSRVVACASRYAELAALALSACVFVHADATADDSISGGDWLAVALARALDVDAPPSFLAACRDRLLARAFAAIDAGEPISLIPTGRTSPGEP